LNPDGEMLYREESIDSQLFGPSCVRGIFLLIIEARCQRYPPHWEHRLRERGPDLQK